MQAPRSFTGRSRRRTTNAWGKASDTIARAVITLGGIGTIVAVLAVGAFLLAVAAPLFFSASAALDRVAPLPDGRASALGTDESGSIAWRLDGAGDNQGRIAVVNLADGATLLDRPAAETGLAGATAVRVPAGGGPEFHGADGFPIAFVPDIEYEQHTLQLAPGDRLYLYSDGVTEAMDKDRQPLGDDAMAAVLGAGRAASLDESVKSLLDRVEHWCQPNGPLDDVSILGLEWRP